ncbi:hypothetical protein AFL01nite_02450 [Aeromicrobium flavum]|uniref:Response regulatory domain-containing protein n=1 Tax=Aeromicrobium flavum TaxID=416568 RepID=A0A512HR43_9ACTN|nr:response regulator transcription factor [Aeromicrobium flavum]GEO87918.1 hypothetical protein AFL01nite_02450 [Aeromicrobium flavum]
MTQQQPRVFLIEDQGLVAHSIMTILREDGSDQYPESPIVPRGSFKWVKSPSVAVDFLRQQAAAPGGWRPDIALVDYHFERSDSASDRMTGLSVLHALHSHSPETKKVIFSGHATRQGRSLFHAAAYHWFDVRDSLSKGGTARDMTDLLSGKHTTPHALAVRLHDHARRIDAFFQNELHLAVLQNWHETSGIDKALEDRLHASRPTITRCKKSLAVAAQSFSDVFDVGLVTDTDDRGRAAKRVKDRLADFLANNHSFFGDPALEDILRRWGPWATR